MITRVESGEVWLADLGMAAKTRPVVILAAPRENDARKLVVVAPLTSQIRHLPGEIELGPVRWLPKLSAVNVQGIASFDPSRLVRKMGVLSHSQMQNIKHALRELFDL